MPPHQRLTTLGGTTMFTVVSPMGKPCSRGTLTQRGPRHRASTLGRVGGGVLEAPAPQPAPSRRVMDPSGRHRAHAGPLPLGRHLHRWMLIWCWGDGVPKCAPVRGGGWAEGPPEPLTSCPSCSPAPARPHVSSQGLSWKFALWTCGSCLQGAVSCAPLSLGLGRGRGRGCF